MKKRLNLILVVALLAAIIFPSNIFAANLTEESIYETIDINKAINGEYDDITVKFLTDKEMIDVLVSSGFSVEDAEMEILEKYSNSTSVNSNFSIQESRNVYLSKRLDVAYNYKPKAEFYCNVEVGHGTGLIRKIYHADLDRSYNGISKEYRGNLHYHLMSYTHIHFNVNGDFYNYGTTTFSGGGSVGVGEVASSNFSISNSSSHFKYVNIKEDIRFN